MQKFLLFFLVSSFLFVLSAHKNYDKQEQQNSQLAHSKDKSTASFIENKGQWHDNILFRTSLSGTFNSLFLEENRLTYQLYNQEEIGDLHERKDTDEAFQVSGHSYHVYFKNAQIPTAKSVGVRAGKNNYFVGNQTDKWARDVNVSEEVIYSDIYPNIDLRLYKIYDDFKYEFIVAPGANPQEIIQKYDGIDDMVIENNQLKIMTSVATVTELTPFTYQIENGVKKQVPCFYHLENNEVRFSFPEGYDTEKELVIDPTVVAATLTGHSVSGSAGVFGMSATYDNAANIYTGGVAFGSGYIVTTGAFEEEFSGEQDIVITKFNPTGTELLYATYVGGAENDFPISMITNLEETIYVYGSTDSPDFPTTGNAFQASKSGEKDIVIYALSAEGNELVNSTFLGGNENDGDNKSPIFSCYGDSEKGEIVLDNQNNVYVTSMTSSADFPINNGFDSSFAENPFDAQNQDAVVLKMNPDLSEIVWSSFLGGTNLDAGMSLRVLDNGEVYVAGFTQGEDFPTTPQAFMSNYPGGNVSGFITKISADGTEILQSTFLGTSEDDKIYFMDVDAEENVHITGTTRGEMPISAGVYSSEQGSPQFITGLSSDLDVLVYSTVIGLGSGGAGYDFFNNDVDFVPNAFTVDKCGNIHLTAYGAADDLPLTEDSFWSMGNTFYMMKLSPLAQSLEFASYYGRSNHVEGGMSRIDQNGTIYQTVCSCTSSGNFALNTNTDAFSVEPNNSTCDVGVFKIEYEQGEEGVCALGSSYIPGTDNILTSGEVPLALDFVFLGQNADDVSWNFGEGTSSEELNPSHTFSEIGTYDITILATNPETCNGEDSYTFTIEVTDEVSNLKEENEIDFTILPNPNNGNFSVLTDNDLGMINFEVFDITGKVLLNKVSDSGRTDFSLDVAAGVYFLRAETELGVISTEKIVVTR